MERVGARSTREYRRARQRSVRARARLRRRERRDASTVSRYRRRPKETTPGRAARRAPAGGCGGSRRRRRARCRSRAGCGRTPEPACGSRWSSWWAGARVGRNARRAGGSDAETFRRRYAFCRTASSASVGHFDESRPPNRPRRSDAFSQPRRAGLGSSWLRSIVRLSNHEPSNRLGEGEPGDRKRRNRSHAVEFRPRLSSRGTARAPKFVWTNSLPRPNLDRIDRARGSVSRARRLGRANPEPRDRSQPRNPASGATRGTLTPSPKAPPRPARATRKGTRRADRGLCSQPTTRDDDL